MENRAAIERLHAEAHAGQRSSMKAQLRLCAERAPRLKLDRPSAAACRARERRGLIVLHLFKLRTRREEMLTQTGMRVPRLRTSRLDTESCNERAQLQHRVARALRPRQHETLRRTQPSLQLRRGLVEHTLRGGFGNARAPLQLDRNERVRIDRRRLAVGVEAGNPQRIELHAGARCRIDDRNRTADTLRLERRFRTDVAQTSERARQTHSARDTVERAELREHAAYLFERLV